MVILSPEPFIQGNLRFRSVYNEIYQIETACSECCLINFDFQKYYSSVRLDSSPYSEILINPHVRVSYTHGLYIWCRYFVNFINFFLYFFYHLFPSKLDNFIHSQKKRLDISMFDYNNTCGYCHYINIL